MMFNITLARNYLWVVILVITESSRPALLWAAVFAATAISSWQECKVEIVRPAPVRSREAVEKFPLLKPQGQQSLGRGSGLDEY